MVVDPWHRVKSQVRPYGPIRPGMLVGFDNPDGSTCAGTLDEIIWTTPHAVNGLDVRTCIVRPLDTTTGAPNWAVQGWQLYRVSIIPQPEREDPDSFRRRVVETIATEPANLHRLDCGHVFWSNQNAAVWSRGAFCCQCYRQARAAEEAAQKC